MQTRKQFPAPILDPNSYLLPHSVDFISHLLHKIDVTEILISYDLSLAFGALKDIDFWECQNISMSKKVDKRILEKAKAITKKRPKTVIDHIIEHGFITTEDLKNYGYNHPPRAARDVREEGIPLETFRVKGTDGRSIGAYRFGDPDAVKDNKLGGRTVFSKDFKKKLLNQQSSKCLICNTTFADRYLQIDHRVPYEVAGESQNDGTSMEAFMLICGTCNRKKSWSCEQCNNWVNSQLMDVCQQCYWADPISYSHIAGKNIRRVELVFEDADVENYDTIADNEKIYGDSPAEKIKSILRDKKD